jgi:hypothetical protein
MISKVQLKHVVPEHYHQFIDICLEGQAQRILCATLEAVDEVLTWARATWQIGTLSEEEKAESSPFLEDERTRRIADALLAILHHSIKEEEAIHIRAFTVLLDRTIELLYDFGIVDEDTYTFVVDSATEYYALLQEEEDRERRQEQEDLEKIAEIEAVTIRYNKLQEEGPEE